ncbi:hypothetical protein M0R45_025840 [Rubus argutus]|uniref:Uncharacterized protein n=1 Tax=Rubus argutus TaxID=59490 RepID=A0AAW1WVW3_RUBAR
MNHHDSHEQPKPPPSRPLNQHPSIPHRSPSLAVVDLAITNQSAAPALSTITSLFPSSPPNLHHSAFSASSSPHQTCAFSHDHHNSSNSQNLQPSQAANSPTRVLPEPILRPPPSCHPRRRPSHAARPHCRHR